MKTVVQRILAMIAVILAIGALGLLTRKFGSLEWMVANETRIRKFVKQQPWQGWFLGLAIYILFSLVPGTAGKSVVFGWLFGFWRALLASTILVPVLIRYAIRRFHRGSTPPDIDFSEIEPIELWPVTPAKRQSNGHN